MASFRIFGFRFEVERASVDHGLLEAVGEKELGVDLVPDLFPLEVQRTSRKWQLSKLRRTNFLGPLQREQFQPKKMHQLEQWSLYLLQS
jgi:hypothetical protein